jgi:Secretion system C-terminal sorting domain
VLVSTEFTVSCDAGTHLYSATADSLTGPFSARKTLYTIPDNDLGHSPFWYGPNIHPEYINDKNELLITYDINGYSNCEPACINNGFDPDYYRPRGIRVPLQLIDSSISPYDQPPAFGGDPFGGHADGQDGWWLNAYPNPAHHCINVSYEGFNSRDAYLVIRNVTGQPVCANRISLSGSTGTYTINLPGELTSGAYFLQMESSVYSRAVKLIIQ